MEKSGRQVIAESGEDIIKEFKDTEQWKIEFLLLIKNAGQRVQEKTEL